MARSVNRLVFPAFVAALLTLGFSSTVIAWDTNCSSSGSKVCVHRDDGLTLPVAAMNGSSSDYGIAKYFNSNDYINNSASSVQNLYTAKDVVWHHDPNNRGGAFCVDSWWTYTWVGHLDNDRFSSHSVSADDRSC